MSYPDDKMTSKPLGNEPSSGPPLPKRRGIGYTTRPLVCAWPDLEPIVGYARTATIRAMHPSGRSSEVDLNVRVAYYHHMAEGPGPTITVIEDLDDPPGYGAHWGEVNTHLHRGLGSLGVITNGSIRDLPMNAPGFQLIAGSVGPSHAYVHVEAVGVPVTVAGMSVSPGDLIHADRHGAVVIPLDVARDLPRLAAELAEREAVLIDASKEAGFSAAILERLLNPRGGDH